jgi:hypothetical protein
VELVELLKPAERWVTTDLHETGLLLLLPTASQEPEYVIFVPEELKGNPNVDV